ncbi:hypothetical protein SAMN04487950_2113 [Halogranum rubrum]|uniref:Uncharacterized protein n=1 Tax=Halogranum rubrum TaxID=553466 RepID=A0A1I4EGA9_9EURY|nr:hypothetical protein [Halogranum rubrum]SFL04030.1 hypothetical protein SAMN04487950_2113 [Halogranum rubrum]
MPFTRRRALLAAVGLSTALGLSGCLSRNTSAVARTYDRARGTYERGPRQGRADSLTVDETVVVDDPDLEYLPRKDAVRFPSLMNRDDVVAYDTTPFGRWSQLQCAEAGLDPVWTVVSERLGGNTDGLGRGAASSFPGMVVELSHTTTVDSDGTVVSEPAVSFDEFLDITPASVTVTVALDRKTTTHTVPVNVIGGTYNPHNGGIRAGPEIVYNDTARPETAIRPDSVRGRASAITAESPALIHHSGVSFDGGEMTLRSWAEDECVDVARDVARGVVTERLGETGGVVWGTTADGVEVQLTSAVDQNGTAVSAPTHSVEEVLDETPRAVTVPIQVEGGDEKLAGREPTFTMPVRVQTRVSTASWT